MFLSLYVVLNYFALMVFSCIQFYKMFTKYLFPMPRQTQIRKLRFGFYLLSSWSHLTVKSSPLTLNLSVSTEPYISKDYYEIRQSLHIISFFTYCILFFICRGSIIYIKSDEDLTKPNYSTFFRFETLLFLHIRR